MKLLLFVFDGLGDRPAENLQGKTPLEAAHTPHLNRIAKIGICGQHDPILPGQPVGSDTGHLSLLGYDPYKVYTGRGPFEAVGIGMKVKPGDVAFRVNFATIQNGRVIDRRAGRINEGTDRLLSPINGKKIEGVSCFIQPSVEHRAALILRGPGLGDRVTDLDPHRTGVPISPCRALDRHSKKTARVLNKLFQESHELLSRHPINKQRRKEGKAAANALLIRGGGRAPRIQSFESRTGLKGGCVAETGLVRGVAQYVGLKTVTPETATGGVDTDCKAVVSCALKLLKTFDFVLVNYKAPDIAGHDGDPLHKKCLIENMDRELLPLVKEVERGNLIMAVTGDHSTPCGQKEHSGDPVPVVIAGRVVRTDSVTTFGERSCARGDLGRIKASDIVPILLDLAGKKEKYGS